MTHRILALALVATLLHGCATNGASGAASSTAAIPASVAAEAARIGPDPAALLARVADGVASETYAGVFRGPAATLADGAGNPYDKALLLHDLVRSAAPALAVRYASCTLAPAQTDALLAAARAAYRTPPIYARFAAKAAAAAAKPSTKAVLQHLDAMWTGTVAQARDESALLANDLKAAGAPSTAPASDARAIAADHVWVQAQQNGAWVDLDPSMPKAKPGDTLCSASSTYDALPDDAYDTIAATLRYETRAGSKLDDGTIANVEARTADLADRSLTFMFGIPPEKGPLAFVPQLQLGSDVTAAPAIVVPSPPPDAAVGSSSMKKAQGGTDFFASPAVETATPEPTPSTATSEPVALWLDVAVTTRGAKPEQVERPIFDRVAFADRSAGRADTATLSEWNDNAYAPFSTVWNIAASLGTAVVGVGDRAKVAPKNDLPTTIRALGGIQRGYYTIRRAVFADERGGAASPVANVSPGISFAGFAPRSFNGTAATVPAMDVASDRAAPDGGDAASAAAWAVASLVTERTVTNADAIFAAVARDLPPSLVPATDVIAVFDASRKGGVATELVASSADVDGLGASADAKARLAAVVGSGSTAFAPAAPVTLESGDDYGWWILAPDGTVHDQMQDGMHTAGAEEASLTPQQVNQSVSTSHTVYKASKIARCAVVIIGLMAAYADPTGATGGSLVGAAEDWEAAEAFYAAAGESTDAIACAAGPGPGPPLP